MAVSYEFGNPDSICGYVDGKKIAGKWDMGGATTRPPMVDDDELWIGSSMGGSAGNSFSGAIDEVVIAREITPATVFADRRIVITHPPRPPRKGVIPASSMSHFTKTSVAKPLGRFSCLSRWLSISKRLSPSPGFRWRMVAAASAATGKDR